jgi:CDP-diglyceride synthetase
VWREGLEKEFKTTFINRSITGLMMVIPFFGLIYFANTLLTTLVITVISILIFLEWGGLARKKNLVVDSLSIIIFVLGYIVFEEYFLYFSISLLAVFWFIFSIFLFRNKLELLSSINFDNNSLRLLVIAGFYSSLLLLAQTNEINNLLIFIIIVNTSLADICAYLVGSRFGKTPLLKNISPNKTFEGFLGGIAASSLFGFLMYYEYQLTASMLLIIIFSSFYAFVGDYFMSYLKRKSNLKDTGSILPGHGGILDRIDSHLSATTIFTFLFILIQTLGI